MLLFIVAIVNFISYIRDRRKINSLLKR
ncbi:TPA: hypothetical protein PIQ92_004485 [Klebsiella pneumoniae]|nr:hypothetical protein [Klebsiella pneumoniae subsp. pneumoniae]HDH0888865.1 hypothetical protein [Klebsiella pneumoniae]